jgi:hypothetical protein
MTTRMKLAGPRPRYCIEIMKDIVAARIAPMARQSADASAPESVAFR